MLFDISNSPQDIFHGDTDYKVDQFKSVVAALVMIAGKRFWAILVDTAAYTDPFDLTGIFAFVIISLFTIL